jgi:hypothetical protein
MAKARKNPASLYKKGKASSKTIGGKKHIWRKGYKIKSGPNKGASVKGRWVKAPKSTKKRRNPLQLTRGLTKSKAPRKGWKPIVKKNPKAKVKKALKISHTYKLNPKWHKSGMGEYVILTKGGRVTKSFTTLAAAKAYSVKMRRAGHRLVRVPKGLKATRKKNPTRKPVRRKVVRRRRVVRRKPTRKTKRRRWR